MSNVKIQNLFWKDMKCRNRGQVCWLFTILPLPSIIAVVSMETIKSFTKVAQICFDIINTTYDWC